MNEFESDIENCSHQCQDTDEDGDDEVELPGLDYVPPDNDDLSRR